MTIEQLPLYVYIDESGDFNFSRSGSRFYTITAVTTFRPWEMVEGINRLRHQILSGDICRGLDQRYLEDKLSLKFHAAEDRQIVRDHFFGVIQQVQGIRTFSIIVRKNKTHPSIQEPGKFYSQLLGQLLELVFKEDNYSNLCIFVDGIPITKRRNAFIAAVKGEINSREPRKPFCIYYPTSASNPYLQVVDYINWAIYRKWELGDLRSFSLIENFLVKPEIDVFKNGSTDYY